SDDVTYSDDYTNKGSKDIYLSFNSAVDGNFSMELLKDNDKKMKYQLFIGQSCNNLTLVEKTKFDYTHDVNLKLLANWDYIIKIVKHSNGNSRYNIAYNFTAIQALSLEEILSKIENGEKVAPDVVVATFKAYYAKFDANANVAITLQLTPIFLLLKDNYEYYKAVILQMYSNTKNHKLLRLPMLELIGYHLDDSASLDTVKAVFSNESDNSFIVAKSAKLLAKKGIDISTEVEKRYPTSTDASKSIYAQLLAFFKPRSSRAVIERDMDNETEVNQMNSLINAFVKTGINDDYVVIKLENMLYHTIPNSDFHPVEKEVLSVGIVIDLAASNRDDRFFKLVKIASNNLFSYTTRSVALRKLSYYLPSNATVDKNDMKARLQQLSQDILSSPNDFQNEKYQELLNKKVLKVINILEGV
ncbi:MAG: hypothetical protein U9N49_05390, partial [Campylobacterota bacterium]|nr:hypothetical protein [Campylobacterota bacterium]